MSIWPNGFILKALLSIVLLVGWPMVAFSSTRTAVALDVEGSVMLVSEFDGFEDESPLVRTDYLSPGNKVRISKGGRVTLLHLGKLQRYIFVGPDEILVDKNRFQRKNRAKSISRSAKPYRGNLMAMLGKNRKTLRLTQSVIGVRDLAGKKFADILILSPLDQEKILAKRPEFRWSAIPGVRSYRFILKTKKGAPVLNTRVSTNQMRLPKKIRLKKGETYTWKVTSRTKTKNITSLEWSFIVASYKEQKDLNLLYPGKKAEISDHVLYAIFLEKMGFVGEAKKRWRVLQKLRPNDSLFQKKAK